MMSRWFDWHRVVDAFVVGGHMLIQRPKVMCSNRIVEQEMQTVNEILNECQLLNLDEDLTSIFRNRFQFFFHSETGIVDLQIFG